MKKTLLWLCPRRPRQDQTTGAPRSCDGDFGPIVETIRISRPDWFNPILRDFLDQK